jgi:4'-phosphopantetheinyl transferase
MQRARDRGKRVSEQQSAGEAIEIVYQPLEGLWAGSREPLQLRAEEVHVWSAALDSEQPAAQELARLLAPDERARAERFTSAVVRNRFVAARGLLRLILARYLRRDATELSFAYGKQGKPALAGDGLQFNLAHSGNQALYAISLQREVGIDIEQLCPDRDHEKLARRFFSPGEVAALESLPPELRIQAFYRCWTCKEAYLKGCGAGMSLPLDSFDVALLPDAAPALLAQRTTPEEVSRWQLFDLAPHAGYCAALAVADCAS